MVDKDGEYYYDQHTFIKSDNSMINKDDIDKILESIDIVELVSEYVTLTRQGKNYKGICPFDNCKEEAFVVAPEKNLTHCFCCGKGGNPVHFLMDLKQIKSEEAIAILAKKVKVDVKK